MIYWLLKDMLTGFVGQIRRSMAGVLLLWLGLSVAAMALTMSFGLAFSTVKQTQQSMPGDLGRMYFFTLNYTNLSQGPIGNRLENREDFTAKITRELVEVQEIAGCFFTIPGYPLQTSTSQGEPVLATMLVFAGEVPLYGGTISDELRKVSQAGGVAINNALAARPQAPQLNDHVFLQQNRGVPVVEIVGLAEQLEPIPHIFAPVALVPDSYGTTRLGLYVVDGTEPEILATKIKDTFFSDDAILISYESGLTSYARQRSETHLVAQVAIFSGVLIAIVAFVNLGSLVSFWILNRKHSLCIRRALGASKRQINSYVLFDLSVISGASLLTSLLVGGILEQTLLLHVRIPLLYFGSLLWGVSLMVLGTLIVGVTVIKASGIHAESALGREL